MVNADFIIKVRRLAYDNGLDLHNYSTDKILSRERLALTSGKTQAEFMTELLREVKFTKGLN